eukprot:11172930-Lingulodinium_polyedra.AAC.1
MPASARFAKTVISAVISEARGAIDGAAADPAARAARQSPPALAIGAISTTPPAAVRDSAAAA